MPGQHPRAGQAGGELLAPPEEQPRIGTRQDQCRDQGAEDGDTEFRRVAFHRAESRRAESRRAELRGEGGEGGSAAHEERRQSEESREGELTPVV